MKTSADFENCARRLKALAEPQRLRIVQCLLGGPRSVSDLAEQLKEEIVKISHHLGVLRHAQLVHTERQGRFIVYRLDPRVAHSHQAATSAQLDLGCCTLELGAAKPTKLRA